MPTSVEEAMAEATTAYEAAEGAPSKLARPATLLGWVLDRQPDHPEALMLMAQVRLEQGDLEESLGLAQRCTQVEPEQPVCWLTIAIIEETQGNHAEASVGYQHYLALTPDGRYAPQAARGLKRTRPPGDNDDRVQ